MGLAILDRTVAEQFSCEAWDTNGIYTGRRQWPEFQKWSKWYSAATKHLVLAPILDCARRFTEVSGDLAQLRLSLSLSCSACSDRCSNSSSSLSPVLSPVSGPPLSLDTHSMPCRFVSSRKWKLYTTFYEGTDFGT